MGYAIGLLASPAVYVPIVVIAVLVGADLLARWSAYGRVDSIALDIWIFGTVDALTRLLMVAPRQDVAGELMLGIGFVGVLVTAGIHRLVLERTRDRMGRLVDDLKQPFVADNHADKLILFDRLQRVLERNMQVDLTGRKRGKRERRTEWAELICALGVPDFNEARLLIDAHDRNAFLVFFGLSGAVFVIVEVVVFAAIR